MSAVYGTSDGDAGICYMKNTIPTAVAKASVMAMTFTCCDEGKAE
jgi:hypothetical protein